MCSKVSYTVVENYKKLTPSTDEKIKSLIKVEPTPFDGLLFESADSTAVKPITIMKIERLPTVWKTTFKIEFSDEIDFDVCDAIGLIVPNPDEIVDRIMMQCHFKNAKIKITRSGENWFKFEGSLRDFIKHRMDLNTIPRKRLLLELSKNSVNKNGLEYLCSPEGMDDYMSLGTRMNTIADILEEFGCSPTVEELLAYCEILKPKYFSLLHSSGKSEILLGVISREVDECEIFGHFSGFVANLYSKCTKSDRIVRCEVPVEYTLRKSALFRGFGSKNIICFCTGTGIAPYIAFYRKLFQNGMIDTLKLVYGFRSAADNLLRYYDVDCDVVLASSSDGKHVYDFIDVIGEEDCNVFICGNMNMQKDVFEKIKIKYPRLVEERRVYFDCWS